MIVQDSIGWIFLCLAATPILATNFAGVSEIFSLSSKIIPEGQNIPLLHANTGVAGGRNISPPLEWKAVPAGSRSLALVCVDRHPIANQWIHWMITNLPPHVNSLEEGASHTGKMPSGSKEWPNSFGSIGWGGPQPPRGSGKHPYEFILYALTVETLNLSNGITWNGFNKALEGKVISSAHLVGTFER
jgi:Raf kinase inhibitor-like YbhB/YbcL family protein